MEKNTRGVGQGILGKVVRIEDSTSQNRPMGIGVDEVRGNTGARGRFLPTECSPAVREASTGREDWEYPTNRIQLEVDKNP